MYATPTSPQSKPLLERLQAINRQFLANFAEQFAQTRHLLNPGIEQAFATLAAEQQQVLSTLVAGTGAWGGVEPSFEPSPAVFVPRAG